MVGICQCYFCSTYFEKKYSTCPGCKQVDGMRRNILKLPPGAKVMVRDPNDVNALPTLASEDDPTVIPFSKPTEVVAGDEIPWSLGGSVEVLKHTIGLIESTCESSSLTEAQRLDIIQALCRDTRRISNGG